MKNSSTQSSAVNAGVASNDIFDANVRKAVSVQACRLIKTGVFPDHMREDLAQELFIILHQEMRNFNPIKSSFGTFARRVLSLRSQNMVRNALTAAEQKGGIGIEAVSIYEQVVEDGDTIGDLIDGDDVRIQMGYQNRSARDMAELRECISLAISHLPAEHKRICLAVLNGESVSSLAREKNLHIFMFRKRYLYPLRPIFIEVGINGF